MGDALIDDGELGEYRIVRPLGHGGMGLVFLGHDAVLDRPVAIKLIATHAPTAAARERFLIEARAIARLAHPNVVAVYRAGETRDGRPFLVQELVRGKSLDRLAMPVAAAEVRRIGVGMARGLAAAHRRGVLHRDLKPANVMLADDGTIKLLDFGLAKLRPLDEPAAPFIAIALPAPTPRVTAETIDGGGPPAPPPPPVAPTPTPTPPPLAVAITADLAPLDDGLAETLDHVQPSPSPSPSLTRPGVLMGTPRYLAPEQWRGEPATERSDLYALAAVLFELAAGRPVHLGDDVDAVRDHATTRDPPPLAEVAPGVDAGLAAIVDRALARDPAQRPASADALALALATTTERDGAAPARVDNPYRGLAAFAAADRGVFFGRGAEVGAIVDRLRTEQAVVIAGDSGVGKSSLVRAGVLPAIEAGGLGGDRAWSAIAVRPGADPVAAVIAALGGGEGDLAAALARATAARRGLVVFVDQAEELITQAPLAEAARLADTLTAALARDPGLRVVATVRGDFVTRLAEVPGLAAWVTRGLHLVATLDDAGRREAIAGPAQVAGVEIEPAAVDALAAGSGGRGGLPLLQFALAQLWQRRDAGAARITLADVGAIGGVAGALSRHADGVIAALDPDGRAAARRLLTSLVTAQGTTAVRDAAELALDAPATRAALDALVAGRLVVARDGAHGAAYALAHDALIDHWATLAGWLDDDRGQRARRDHLTAAAGEWERLGRGRDGLLTRRQLAEVAGLDALGGREVALVAASRRALTRRRAVLVAAALGAIAAVLAAWLGTRWTQARARDRAIAGHVATAGAIITEVDQRATALTASRAAALALYDRDDDVAGEPAWAAVLADTVALRRRYAEAAAALEAALLLDPRPSLRRRMAELLYAHALVAERAYDRAGADELLQRIAGYDRTVARRWTAPGHLTIALDTAADVTVRCLEGDLALRRYGAPLFHATGDRTTITLAPASCLVEATAADRVVVRAPFVLHRGEDLTVALTLPPKAAAPPDFAFIPRGRFLFGSGDLDIIRISLAAYPQHEVELPAFWIARHETTIAEWIAFLDDLPPAERALHRPASDAISGALALIAQPDGSYAYSYHRDDVAYLVHRGELLHYRDRTHHVDQRWEQFPVAAITVGDAAAYLAWLDRTGRVPGARLCSMREWERAARGADDRRFPHADTLSPDDVDIDATYHREKAAYGPDEVGSHPASDSPFGVSDLAGNVWELVTGPDGHFVIRGGSWYQGVPSAPSSNNWTTEPGLRNALSGLRVCATAR